MTNQKTLVIIKPDGIQRSLIGEIIKRYEQTGLKLIALKFLVPDEEMVERHYLASGKEWIEKVGKKTIQSYKDKGMKPVFSDPIECGKFVLGVLKKYLTSGPVLAMIWQGNEAVGVIKKITGGTEPLTSDVGTIRGDFTVDSYHLADTNERAVRNLIHISALPEEAEKEIPIWFSKDEILKYRLIQERILYDVNLDGIKE